MDDVVSKLATKASKAWDSTPAFSVRVPRSYRLRIALVLARTRRSLMQRPKVAAPVTLICSLLFVVMSGPVVLGQQPVNDNCVDAQSIDIFGPGQYFFDFSTVGANSDSVFVDPSTCGFEEVFNNVWFCYTAPITGTGTVSTCVLTDFETSIVVFQGCGCPATPANVVG